MINPSMPNIFTVKLWDRWYITHVTCSITGLNHTFYSDGAKRLINRYLTNFTFSPRLKSRENLTRSEHF